MERHYYKVRIHRFPPYYPINKDYRIEKFVWGYTRQGAENSVQRGNKKGFGHHCPEEFIEITKEEYYQTDPYDRIN